MSEAKPSLRVYLVEHVGGGTSGRLIRPRAGLHDGPAPAAYGRSEAEVLEQIEIQLRERQVDGESLHHYLWVEPFHVRQVAVDVLTASSVKGVEVIGTRTIPLRMTYAWSRLPGGAYRVVLPRFEWTIVLESLDDAPEVLRRAVATALLGEQAQMLYDFREEGDERVREWVPGFLRGQEPWMWRREEPGTGALSEVAECWTELAARNKLAPVVGLDLVPAGLFDVLESRPPPSLLLVGPPGVGKTALVRRLAFRAVELRRLHKARRYPQLWSTTGDRILAGMIYLGMWQQRCLRIVEELRGEGDWLHVDRLGSILGRQPDGSSIGDMLLPAVAARDISLIAECTEPELTRLRERMPGLLAELRIVRLEQPSPLSVPAMVGPYQTKKRGSLRLDAGGLDRLVRYLDAYERTTAFPGKAFRFLDWMAKQTRPTPARSDGEPLREPEIESIAAHEVAAWFSRWSGLPEELVADERPLGVDGITAILRRGIVGQDAACAEVARVIARFKAGMHDPERPIGTLLFVGPTGVGKTELAKQTARWLFAGEERLIRVDMSELMTPGSASVLLESGEGRRSLAELVRQMPLSVVLFDEVEKAHPEVLDLLLGILGEGRLTDDLGRFVDFRSSLIVMTSNLGAAESRVSSFGAAPLPDYVRAVREHLRPEMFARIDHVVSFGLLGEQAIRAIVDLELAKAAERTGLVRRGLRLRVSPAGKDFLANVGFDRRRGARPLRRAIEDQVIAPLAELLARDPRLRDRTIDVLPSDGGLTLVIGG